MQFRRESEQSGSNPAEHFRSIDASELSSGHRLVLPDGETTAHVVEVDTVLDDYDNPALYFAVLENHMNLRVAHGTSVRIVVPRPTRPADLLFAGPTAAPTPDLEGTGPDLEGTGPDLDGTGPDLGEEQGEPERLPDPEPPAEPVSITLDTGDVVVVPGKVRAANPNPPRSQLRHIPALEGEPEDLIRHIDAVHPGRHAVHELSERLVKGINPKSGACLKDLRDLAYELYVGQNDPENALKIADLLAVVPFDGNPGRWSSVESGLALAHHLAGERNEKDRAAAYSVLLRAPETAEKDPFRARMAARVRQRTLNEPDFYDKEVARAAEAHDEAEERNWRILRLDTLLHLRAHGGSEAFDDAELDRRIQIELDVVRR
ncbi:DUF6707 family protein [Sinomonas sp.]|uniref:DUF6707 family protein n=1 Tax=Sinomonas sp. TaxID=1914986 RepID=UPI003F7D8D2A